MSRPRASDPDPRAVEAGGEEDLAALKRLLSGATPAIPAEAPPCTGESGPPPAPPPGDPRFEPAASGRDRAREDRFGSVFPALDRARHARPVRVLELWPESVRRPGLERRLEELDQRLGALGSPAVARLDALARGDGGSLALASDLAEGESLRTLLATRATLPPEHALEIARQVLAALEPAHARGLVHGALAPERVWLEGRVPWDARNPFGVRVVLLDLGLAGVLDEEPPTERDDLAATIELLVEALTGARARPSSSEWPAVRAGLPGRLGWRLERALADPRASARTLHRALARSATSRLPTRARVAGFAGLLLVVLGLALARARATHAAEARAERLAAALAQAQDALDEEQRDDERAALALERFLGRIEEGDRDGARAVLEAAQAAGLDRAGFEGGYLSSLLEARRALDAVARSSALRARVRALGQARAALEAARPGREAFLIAGARWLARSPSRAEAAPRWQASLEDECARDSATLQDPVLERLDALVDPRGTLAPGAESAEVLELAAELARSAQETLQRRLAGSEPSALRVRLALLLGRPYPGARGDWRLFAAHGPDARVGWVRETVLESGPRGWLLERRTFDREGREESRVEHALVRRGTRLQDGAEPASSLELADDGPALTPFVPAATGTPPTPLAPSSAELAVFRARLAREGAHALVLVRAGGETWFSETLGLLRERAPDGSGLELVFVGQAER